MPKTDLFAEGQSLVKRSKYREALRVFKRTLKAAADEDERIESLMALADTARMTGDYNLAVDWYVGALEAMEQAADPDEVRAFDAMAGLALAKRAMGHWAAALAALAPAEAHYAETGDAEGMAFVTWARAGTLRIKGDIPEAVKGFTLARKLFAKLNDPSGVGYSDCGIGGTSRVLGDYKRSMKHYEQANEAFRAMRDSFGTAYSHCGLGNAMRMEGRYEDAREQFLRATTIYQRISDVVSYSYTLWSLGKTHAMLGNLGLAEKFYKDARTNFRRTRDPRGVVYCRLGLAELIALASPGKAASTAAAGAARALREAEAWEFGVEAAHARVLLGWLRDGVVDNAPYRALGLRLRYDSAPFNIP
jgi:tetratricopeptide (TPR) repeat protein